MHIFAINNLISQNMKSLTKDGVLRTSDEIFSSLRLCRFLSHHKIGLNVDCFPWVQWVLNKLINTFSQKENQLDSTNNPTIQKPCCLFIDLAVRGKLEVFFGDSLAVANAEDSLEFSDFLANIIVSQSHFLIVSQSHFLFVVQWWSSKGERIQMHWRDNGNRSSLTFSQFL